MGEGEGRIRLKLILALIDFVIHGQMSCGFSLIAGIRFSRCSGNCHEISATDNDRCSSKQTTNFELCVRVLRNNAGTEERVFIQAALRLLVSCCILLELSQRERKP